MRLDRKSLQQALPSLCHMKLDRDDQQMMSFVSHDRDGLRWYHMGVSDFLEEMTVNHWNFASFHRFPEICQSVRDGLRDSESIGVFRLRRMMSDIPSQRPERSQADFSLKWPHQE